MRHRRRVDQRLIPWLEADEPFPPLSAALGHPNGLLAASADLNPARVLDAYRHGIFPWFNDSEPVLWWSPDPRMVLFTAELRVTRSLDKTLRNRAYEVRHDTAFREVMMACAAPRHGQRGTWITDVMLDVYCGLHRDGWAHSVETWIDGELAGGLYGMAIGNMFFGESMFARVRDASKIALVHLVKHLDSAGFPMLDCQMATDHLASLGAREIERAEFSRRLAELVDSAAVPSAWRAITTLSQR